MGVAPDAPPSGRLMVIKSSGMRVESKTGKAFTDRLVADGTKMDMAYTDVTSKMGLKIAFFTDPNGTYIELTEGLNAK